MVGSDEALMSGEGKDPSTILAMGLAIMNDVLQANPTILSSMVEIASEVRDKSEPIWGIDADTLYDCLGLDLEDFSSLMAPDLLARWIGSLDAWHRFANPAGLDLTAAVVPSAARDAEARLEREGAFNSQRDKSIGILIPRVCADVPGAAYTSRRPLRDLYDIYRQQFASSGNSLKENDDLPAANVGLGVNALLQNCVWLPRLLLCGHPDGTERPLREVLAGYVPIGAGRKTLPLPLGDDLRIAVAPLAETAACVDVVVTDAGKRYLVAPAFSVDRVKAAITRSFADGAHILLLPEMTIDSIWIGEIADFVRATRRVHRRANLRYILLGTTTKPADSRIGENFVSIIDGGGNIITSPLTGGDARQNKICRWNLSVGDQRRFGFDRRPNGSPPLAPIVSESIVEADTVFVFDILGFGRLVCLICASLDHNQPADWLVQNAQPDWIYAPVMDSSAGLGAVGMSPLAKWTVRRAIRAACLSRGRVIVSNSMALQQLENIENNSPALPDGSPKGGGRRAPDLTPGLALMIDGRGDDLRHLVMQAPIPARADDTRPIVMTEPWGEGWGALPAKII